MLWEVVNFVKNLHADPILGSVFVFFRRDHAGRLRAFSFWENKDSGNDHRERPEDGGPGEPPKIGVELLKMLFVCLGLAPRAPGGGVCPTPGKEQVDTEDGGRAQ